MIRLRTFAFQNSSIARINHERNNIQIDPEYQRQGDLWNTDKRQLLIDSILNDYDIPKLYLHFLSKPRKVNGNIVGYAIIDGRQRLETIWGFINNTFALADDFVYYKDPKVKAAGLTYSQLTSRYPNLKMIFDSYTLPVICVETEKDNTDVIDDMFSRLNEAVPLNAAEKRNAIGGPMTTVIREIAAHQFFKNNAKFSNKRYLHQEIAAKLLFIEDNILNDRLVDTKKIYLDKFVREIKKNNDKKITQTLGRNVRKILDKMAVLFQEKDELLSSNSSVPIYYILVGASLKYQRKLTRGQLVAFAAEISDNRQIASDSIENADFDKLEFYRLSIQGTNDASSIRERMRIISGFCKVPNILSK